MWHRLILSFVIVLFPLALPMIAGADHPGLDQMEQVKAIAHELQEATEEAHSIAFQYSGVGWREQYALEHLGHLETAAHHFHQQVESFFNDPGHTEHDYLALRHAYLNAESTLFDLRANHYLEFKNQWNRVRQLMSQLQFYYGNSVVNPPPAPIQVVITQIEHGGNISQTTVKLYGYLQGLGITHAGVYVDGILRSALTINPYSTRHDFYARLKWSRFLTTQHRVEIRVRLYNGPEQTVWARVF